MGKKVEENDETEQINSIPTLKFPFLPFPAATIHSPDHHPLQTLASVPFKWEEQPGKPRPCTDIIPLPIPGPARIILEPPPCSRRVTTAVDPISNKITKMPSPTAVLDGPYAVARPKFSSFRFLRESFDSTSSDSPYSSEDVLLGGGRRRKGRGFFSRGLRFKSGKKEVDEGSLGFSPSSSSTGFSDERFKMRKNGSLKSVSQPTSPHLCATIYERLKQAVPWKSTRKSRKHVCNV